MARSPPVREVNDKYTKIAKYYGLELQAVPKIKKELLGCRYQGPDLPLIRYRRGITHQDIIERTLESPSLTAIPLKTSKSTSRHGKNSWRFVRDAKSERPKHGGISRGHGEGKSPQEEL